MRITSLKSDIVTLELAVETLRAPLARECCLVLSSLVESSLARPSQAAQNQSIRLERCDLLCRTCRRGLARAPSRTNKGHQSWLGKFQKLWWASREPIRRARAWLARAQATHRNAINRHQAAAAAASAAAPEARPRSSCFSVAFLPQAAKWLAKLAPARGQVTELEQGSGGRKRVPSTVRLNTARPIRSLALALALSPQLSEKSINTRSLICTYIYLYLHSSAWRMPIGWLPSDHLRAGGRLPALSLPELSLFTCRRARCFGGALLGRQIYWPGPAERRRVKAKNWPR